MPRRGGRRRKTRTHEADAPAGASTVASSSAASSVAAVDAAALPRSFVVKRGDMGAEAQLLVADIRKLLAPYTAEQLREKKSNSLKDFVAAAAALKVNNLVLLSQSAHGNVHMRLCRLTDGPTLTMRLLEYTPARDVRAAQRKPYDSAAAYRVPPLAVLHSFGGREAPPTTKLLRVTLQNMFPPIDVATAKLADCRRVVLFRLDAETGVVHMRHYAIRNKPLGVSRSVRKVVSSGSSAIPNLRNVVDIAHYVTGESGAAANGGDASDSEGEDDLGNELPSELFDDTSSVGSRGGPRGKARSAVKLTEIGPRMSMRLIKVERGVCSGDVMFHAFEKRSATEALKQKRTHDDKVGVVKARRDEQRANVKRKRDGVVAKREAKAARREARAAEKAEAAEEEGGGAAAAAAPARDRAGPARNKGRDDEEEGDLVFDLKSIGRARI